MFTFDTKFNYTLYKVSIFFYTILRYYLDLLLLLLFHRRDNSMIKKNFL